MCKIDIDKDALYIGCTDYMGNMRNEYYRLAHGIICLTYETANDYCVSGKKTLKSIELFNPTDLKMV